jgi:hypothetical protein
VDDRYTVTGTLAGTELFVIRAPAPSA